MLKPIKLSPVFKEIIWGGNRLKTEYNKNSDLKNIAESWELTVRGDGMNTIIGGEFDGCTMKEYIEKMGEKVISNTKQDFFPLLIKFIDACDNLSVQVHPDDEYGLKNANSLGKTEMWYIIDAKPGSQLVYGLKKGVTNEMFAEAIKNGNVENMLNYVPVKKGDVFFIPSGLVHAIGAGILLAEIQQNSNITYRVYDYCRVGKDGKPRELHIEDALNVIVNRDEKEIDEIRYSKGKTIDSNLANCDYFNVCLYDVKSAMFFNVDYKTFNSVLCLDGEGTIFCNNQTYTLTKGDSYFIPAGIGAYVVNGNVKIIVSKMN